MASLDEMINEALERQQQEQYEQRQQLRLAKEREVQAWVDRGNEQLARDFSAELRDALQFSATWQHVLPSEDATPSEKTIVYGYQLLLDGEVIPVAYDECYYGSNIKPSYRLMLSNGNTAAQRVTDDHTLLLALAECRELQRSRNAKRAHEEQEQQARAQAAAARKAEEQATIAQHDAAVAAAAAQEQERLAALRAELAQAKAEEPAVLAARDAAIARIQARLRFAWPEGETFTYYHWRWPSPEGGFEDGYATHGALREGAIQSLTLLPTAYTGARELQLIAPQQSAIVVERCEAHSVSDLPRELTRGWTLYLVGFDHRHFYEPRAQINEYVWVRSDQCYCVAAEASLPVAYVYAALGVSQPYADAPLAPYSHTLWVNEQTEPVDNPLNTTSSDSVDDLPF